MLPNTRDDAQGDLFANDFKDSFAERGLSKKPSHSWWFPAVGVVLIVLLLLYVWLVR